MNTQTKTRVGMIGCGVMSANHVRSLSDLSERMLFTAFADIDLSRAKQAAQASPGAIAVERYEELLDHVDAVVISLPHDLHFEVGVACLKAGKHVLMEKPLALNEDECRTLIAMDRSPNPVLTVGYVMRYDPLWTQFGELLRKRTCGEPFQVSVWTEQYTDDSRGAWIREAKRVGGGQLFSHGCHYIDLLLHWLGDPVEGTHVGTNLGTPWMEREGTSNVSLKFASGATAYHFGTWGARGARLGYAVHAHCTGGMLELDYQKGTIILHRDLSGGDLPAEIGKRQGKPSTAEPQRTETLLYQRPGQAEKAAVQQMENFLDCIEHKRKPEISALASLRSLRVIWKLYEAEDKGVVADLRGL